jgi:hypothetical protein
MIALSSTFILKSHVGDDDEGDENWVSGADAVDGEMRGFWITSLLESQQG